MPAQPLLLLAASRDEVLAVVDQQTNVERLAVQVRSREILDTFLRAPPATLNASIESDLPRSRAERERPPCAWARRARPARRGRSRNRSNAPDTCRQSSIAHTRSGSSARAHASSLPKLSSACRHRQLPARGGGERIDRPAVWVFLWVSVPITIMLNRPFDDELTKRTPADTSHSGLVPSSYQVTPVVLGRRRATRHPSVRPPGRQKVNESARRQPENQPERSDVAAERRLLSKKVKGLAVSLGTSFG